MAKIGSLVVDLELESAAFLRDLAKSAKATEDATKKMSAGMAALQKGLGIVRNVAIGAIGAISFDKILDEINDATDEADKFAAHIGWMAKQVDLTTEQYQLYGDAVKTAGISQGQYDLALQSFNTRLGQARAGQGSLFNSLRATNPALLEQLRNAKSTGAALEIFYASLAKTPGTMDQARLASAAFGQQLSKLYKAVGSGAGSIDELREKFGASVISPQAIKAVDDAKGSVIELHHELERAFAKGYVESFTDRVTWSEEEIKSMAAAATEAGNAIGQVMTYLTSATKTFIKALEDAKAAYDKLNMSELGRFLNRADDIANSINQAVISAGRATHDFLFGPAPDYSLSAHSGSTGGRARRPLGEESLSNAPPPPTLALPRGQQRFIDNLALSTKQYQALIAAAKDGQTAFNAVNDQFEATADVLNRSIDPASKLGQQLVQSGIEARQFGRQLNDAVDQMQVLPQLADQVGSSISSSFADAIVEGGKLSYVLADLAKQIEKMALNTFFQRLIGGAPSASSNGTGLLGALLGGFGGFRAAGGPVSPGKAYGVGEKGPELFVPDVAGQIVPSHDITVRPDQSSNTKGGTPIVFNINTPDVAGFKRSQGQIAAMLNRTVSRGSRNL